MSERQTRNRSDARDAMRRAQRRSALRRCLLPFLVLCGVGCSGLGPRTSPYAQNDDVPRDPQGSQSLAMRAAELIDTDPAKATQLLRRALALDLFNGPAHNNLGTIYLTQGKLYEAAGEFEWARKLMPGHPDPRINLGLTLERAGRFDEALHSYQTALEVHPGHLPAAQALAALQLRTGRADHRTDELLRTIALEGTDETWRAWAQRQAIGQQR